MDKNSHKTCIRRRCAGLWACLSFAGLSSLSWAQTAQTWPTQTVRIVVPYAAGNAVDATARVIAQKVSEIVSGHVVIENKGGAAGAVGSAAVAKAPPDGYTLLFGTSSTHAIAPHLPAKFGSRLPYDVAADFTPIVHMGDSPMVLTASNALPARNMAELIALARAQPGSLNHAHSGNGTISHLAGEMLNQQAQIEITHVPYSSAAIMADLIANHVQLRFDALPSALVQMREGTVRGLAISSMRRASAVPDLPTLDESGLPGFSAVPWFGLFGPKAMDPALVERINAVFTQAVQAPDLAQRLADIGVEPIIGSAQEFATFVAQDRARWGQFMRGMEEFRE